VKGQNTHFGERTMSERISTPEHCISTRIASKVTGQPSWTATKHAPSITRVGEHTQIGKKRQHRPKGI
jgi:hypothetical protein